MSSHPDAGAPVQLFALRLLAPALPPRTPGPGGLQGEVEHVLTGARCSFHSAAELVAWLQDQPAPPVGPGSTVADQAAGAAPRDATM